MSLHLLPPNHAPHAQADGHPGDDIRLHVCDLPIKAAGDWFVQCACGWVSSPQVTFQSACSLHCGVEEAELEGHRYGFVLRRKLAEDAEFDRALPLTSTQA